MLEEIVSQCILTICVVFFLVTKISDEYVDTTFRVLDTRNEDETSGIEYRMYLQLHNRIQNAVFLKTFKATQFKTLFLKAFKNNINQNVVF